MYNMKRSQRVYQGLNQLTELEERSKLPRESAENNYTPSMKTRQSTSLPERSRPIAITNPRSVYNHQSNKRMNNDLDEDDLFEEDRPNGKAIHDLMVECTQVLGNEAYVFYYPIEIGDWSVNLWSKDQKMFSMTIFENGRPVSLQDSRLKDWLAISTFSSPSLSRAGNHGTACPNEFNIFQIEKLLSHLRCVWQGDHVNTRFSL